MAQHGPPTVQSIKQRFITEQTRLLSQPLAPSRTWRAGNSAAAREGADAHRQHLTDRAVEEAMLRLNHRLRQHSRRFYAPAATRHVAEQLEQLYLRQSQGGDGVGTNGDGDNDTNDSVAYVRRRDLASNTERVASLPESWPSDEEAESYPTEAQRYADNIPRLRDLSGRRDALKMRIAHLRAMREALAPFRTAEDGNHYGTKEGGGTGGVQQNLVTRDGELERELERMRLLMARVGDRVARLKDKGADAAGSAADDSTGSLFREDDDAMVVDLEGDERRKVAEILDRF